MSKLDDVRIRNCAKSHVARESSCIVRIPMETLARRAWGAMTDLRAARR